MKNVYLLLKTQVGVLRSVINNNISVVSLFNNNSRRLRQKSDLFHKNHHYTRFITSLLTLIY